MNQVQTPAVHEVKMVQSADDYSRRWVQPRHKAARFDAEVQLSGSFKHNRHHPFEVVLFDDEQGYAAWHGGYAPPGAVGGLKAVSIAITAWKEEKPGRIPVKVGDIIRTSIGDFEIRDDWALHDPYLVRVVGEMVESKVIREAVVGDSAIELARQSWEHQGGAAGGLMGSRYELSVSDGGMPVVFGSYVNGSEAISAWQRLVAFEEARRKA